MIDRVNDIEKSDHEVVFYDGFLYVITRSGKDRKSVGIKEIVLSPEYDEPMSLSDIAKLYPNVSKVIFEGAFKGSIFNYKNHPDSDDWELVGTTIGYA